MTQRGRLALLLILSCAGALPRLAQAQQQRVVIATNVACRGAPSTSAPVARQYSIGETFLVRGEENTAGERWILDSSRVPPDVAAGCWIREDLTADWSQPERALLLAVERLLERPGDVPFEDYVAVDNFLQQTPAGPHRETTYLEQSALLQLRQLELLDRAARTTETSRRALSRQPLKNAWFWARRSTYRYFEPAGSWVVPASAYWALFDTHRQESIAEDIAWAAANGAVLRDECYAGCQLQRLAVTYGRYLQEYPNGRWVNEALTAASGIAEAAAAIGCYDDHAEARAQLTSLGETLSRVTSSGVTRLHQVILEVEQRCSSAVEHPNPLANATPRA